MDTTLVINPGSASKKYAFYRGTDQCAVVHFESTPHGVVRSVEVRGVRKRPERTADDMYEHGLYAAVELAIREGVIGDKADVGRIGVRVVSPGTYFRAHRVVTDEYEKMLEAMGPFAPLHVPPAILEIRSARALFPGVRLSAISDSAFHAFMPPCAHRYSIPEKDAERLDLYRFGYHGLSVASALRNVERLQGKVPRKVIVCHVGGGVSVSAVLEGKSIDTTMGFAPGDGLLMGARSGDVDAGALLYLIRALGIDAARAEAYLHKEGGLRALVGESDLRIALDRSARGDRKAEEALEMFFYGIRKAIGASAAALGGLDTLVLTATACERNPLIRAKIAENLEHLGVHIDRDANERLTNAEGDIATEESAARVFVLKTREFDEMARITDTMCRDGGPR